MTVISTNSVLNGGFGLPVADARQLRHAMSRAARAVSSFATTPVLTISPAAARHRVGTDVADPASIRLQPGDRVVLLGTTCTSRDELQATLLGRGYLPWPWVTRKTSLLVVAAGGADEQSIRRAGAYGVPIIDESALAALLG